MGWARAKLEMQSLVMFSEFGAANLFFPWFQKKENKKIIFSMPQSLSQKLQKSFHQSEHTNIIQDKINFESIEEFYVAPTRTNTYSEILSYAKSKSKGTYGLLDNWIFFEDRIKDIYPDKIIVTDEWALERAVTCFSGKCDIELIQNLYLSEIKIKLKLNPGYRNKIVYIHASSDIHFEAKSGIHGVECICKDIVTLRFLYPEDNVVIRMHPSVKKIPCVSTTYFQQNVLVGKLSISDNISLEMDLIDAKLIVGIPSYALYISSQCGITTKQTRKTNKNWYGPRFDYLDLT